MLSTTASQNEREGSRRETNYEIHSTIKPDIIDSYSGSDTEDLFSFYPTFGTKFPHSEDAEETTKQVSTTEQVNIEDLEAELMKLLEKLAERHSNE